MLHDEELAKAIIDRTLHHGEYLKLTGSSYRLKGRSLNLDTPASGEATTTSTERLVQGGD